MRTLLTCAVLICLPALAGTPLDGTWVSKEDTATLDKRPYTISLAKGIWKSDGPVPPLSVKADGFDYPVKGHAYFDTVSARSTGKDSVEVRTKKAGNAVRTSVFSVSADGYTLTQTWTDQSTGTLQSGEVAYERVGKVLDGAHPVSGTWRAKKIQHLSASAKTVTYKVSEGKVSMSTPAGISYEAGLDGKEVPVQGDPAKTTITVKMANPSTLVETSKRSGKIVEVDRMTVAADGKSMNVEWDDREAKRKGSLMMEKSP
jgi:hypothetical protein